MQKIEIPIKPRPKQRPRYSMGHAYTPKETQQYERAIGAIIREKMTERYTKWVFVRMDFQYVLPKSASKEQKRMVEIAPIIHNKRPDIDNLQKGLLDACLGILWDDDSIVWAIVAQKHYSTSDKIIIETEGE